MGYKFIPNPSRLNKVRISLGFILAVLGSIVLVSAISNYAIGLVDEHNTKVENVVIEI